MLGPEVFFLTFFCLNVKIVSIMNLKPEPKKPRIPPQDCFHAVGLPFLRSPVFYIVFLFFLLCIVEQRHLTLKIYVRTLLRV